MPRRTRAQIDADYKRTEKRILQAFLAAVAEVIEQVSIGELTAAIAANNLEDILDQIALGEQELSAVTEEIRAALIDEGVLEAQSIQSKSNAAGRIKFRFNARNTTTENLIRTITSDFVTAVSQTQREAIRVTLQAGTIAGKGASQIALDLVGRVNKATGRRDGGVIGLDEHRAAASARARRELASNDPGELGNYLNRKARDRRFDRAVQKAAKSGTAVAKAISEKAAASYNNRLLKVRAESIAVTENTNAREAGKQRALEQVVEDDHVDPEFVTKTWDSSGDNRTRTTHAAADGQKRRYNEPFNVGGYELKHPGDTSLGAAAKEVIGCRCIERTEIDFIGNAKKRGLI